MKPLTDKQREALALIATGPRNPFDFGSTTVNRLRSAGLVRSEARKVATSMLVITDAGLAALKGGA